MRLAQTETLVFIDKKRTLFPSGGSSGLFSTRILDILALATMRCVHAKLIVARSADRDHVLFRSPKCTVALLVFRPHTIVWGQWKRGRTRFTALRRLGVGKDLAADPPGVLEVLGGPAIAPHSPSLYPTPSSPASSNNTSPSERSNNRFLNRLSLE